MSHVFCFEGVLFIMDIWILCNFMLIAEISLEKLCTVTNWICSLHIFLFS